MSPATLALAFVNSRWFVAGNIIGATTMEQLAEDIASADVTLPADAIAEIDRIHSAYLEPAQ
jgi:aryl-alcohol dehydrogenase-like predicted oxidoreductase